MHNADYKLDFDIRLKISHFTKNVKITFKGKMTLRRLRDFCGIGIFRKY